eukprot:PhM_4_TR466/c0_g2_i1/m.80207
MPRRKVNGVSLREIGVHTHVAKVFESQNLGSANPLQAAIIPAVLDQCDIFAEAPAHSGRKVAALMCVHQAILTAQDKTRGPVAVILVPSSPRMAAYVSLFDICKPAGIRVTFYNDEQHGPPGDIVVVTARKLNELIQSDVIVPSRLIITVVDDASAFEINALERAVSSIRNKSATCMLVAMSQTTASNTDTAVRQSLRADRQYFFRSVRDVRTNYSFLLCREKEKVDLVGTVLDKAWTPNKKVLILTSRRESRQHFESLNSNGVECYYLVSTTSPTEYQRILHEFLIEDVEWSTLIVGGKLYEVDLVDVDIVVMTSPPAAALADESDRADFARHFSDTICPSRDLDIFVLSTVDELNDVVRMQETLGLDCDVLDVSISHNKFESILYSEEPSKMHGARVYEIQ